MLPLDSELGHRHSAIHVSIVESALSIIASASSTSLVTSSRDFSFLSFNAQDKSQIISYSDDTFRSMLYPINTNFKFLIVESFSASCAFAFISRFVGLLIFGARELGPLDSAADVICWGFTFGTPNTSHHWDDRFLLLRMGVTPYFCCCWQSMLPSTIISSNIFISLSVDKMDHFIFISKARRQTSQGYLSETIVTVDESFVVSPIVCYFFDVSSELWFMVILIPTCWSRQQRSHREDHGEFPKHPHPSLINLIEWEAKWLIDTLLPYTAALSIHNRAIQCWWG